MGCAGGIEKITDEEGKLYYNFVTNSFEDAIGSTAVHEHHHVTNQDNINQSERNRNNGVNSPATEIEADNIELKDAKERQQINSK